MLLTLDCVSSNSTMNGQSLVNRAPALDRIESGGVLLWEHLLLRGRAEGGQVSMTDCAEGGGSRRRAGRPQRPLDPASGPAAAFACALRELRAEAGNPSYRELARRALFVPSVLSTAASGSVFPSLRVTLAFVRACGGDAEEWRRRWEAVAAHADPASSGSLTFPQRLAADGPRPQLLPGGA